MGVALALPTDLDNLRQALQTSVLKLQQWMLHKDLMIFLDSGPRLLFLPSRGRLGLTRLSLASS